MNQVSGVEILRAIQSIQAPFWDAVFGAITNLHHEMIYILVLPLIYWLYDKRFGRYLFTVFAIGFWSNDLLKEVFKTARPDPSQVRVILAETGGGYSFPSGHSQTPLVFWGAIALHVQRRWFTWLVGIMLFLIGLSRLYIGVHWPLDVLGGWVIGLLVLAALNASRSFWRGEHQGLLFKLSLSVLIPALALTLSGMLSGGEVASLTWVIAGAYGGLLAGSALEEAFVGFNPRTGGPAAQVLKLVVGLAMVLAVKEGLKLILPDSGLGDMIRYWLVAVAATLAAPWVFHRFIASPPSSAPIARAK